MVTAEGPCIVVVWRDAKRGSISYRARFFPRFKQTDRDAQDECFEWFASRRSIVLSMEWGWGDVPAGMTQKGARVALGT